MKPDKNTNYQVAIPSFKRAEATRKLTIGYLLRTDIPKEKVTIFVSTPEEKPEYERTCKGFRVVVAEGCDSLVEKRKFINNFYPKGTPVVSFDDDVSGVRKMVLDEPLEGTQKPLTHRCHLEDVLDLDSLITEGFLMCEDRGVGLWGAYQVANQGFLHPKVSVGLKFIMGHFLGFYSGDEAFDKLEEYPCKDDVYLSLWHHANGKGSLRFDGYCVKSKAHSGSGGTNEDKEEKLRINNDTCERICRDFPDTASLKSRRTKDSWLSQYKEIRLKTETTETTYRP
jgi:hypothetical protein